MKRTAVLGWSIAGFSVGVLLCLFILSVKGPPPQQHELSDMLQDESRHLFPLFQQKKIIKRLKLPFIDTLSLDVDIVSEVRGGSYGFTKIVNAPNVLWIAGSGFSLHKFDDHHLFVTISDWRVDEIERDAKLSR